ncbi:TetR family transcriptional regulator [Frondihabitans sp. 4ASC-45]|uniref:acyl-CoA-like ligand-binding transcription factor n=1 Tax=Frondihabitans sp. 4ASC-45 TaxID=3111636 RepID=UPI003C16C9E2
MERRAAATRDIGRNAIRKELARSALTLFLDRGFEKVTFDVLAAEAGVSRSTYLRYFAVKEDVVLFVFDTVFKAMLDALSVASGHGDTEWEALRRSLTPAADFLSSSDQQLRRMQLVWRTPALYSRLHQKQATWRPPMAERLSSDGETSTTNNLALRTRVAAALECLSVAIGTWLEGDGEPDLHDLLDQTFQAIATTR